MKRKRLGTLFSQELIVASRSKFYIFILIILAVSTVTVYLIPEEIGMASELYIFDSSGVLQEFSEKSVTFVDSEADLRERVRAKTANRGLLIERQDGGRLSVKYLYNGNISSREANLAEIRMRTFLSAAGTVEGFGSDETGSIEAAAEAQRLEIRTYRSGSAPMDNGTKLLLILLAFEVVVIGYLFSAVIILKEKQEGTVKAFRVTPGSAGVYLAAKTIFWTVVGIVYGALMLFAATLFSLPPRAWLHIMSAVFLSAIFYTLVGIGIAVYFTTLSEWFIVGVMVLIINMLPIIALEYPGFSNPALKWIPSHPFLFWLEEVFRESAGGGGAVAGAGGGPGSGGRAAAAVFIGKLVLFVVLGAVFAFLSVRRKVMKEGIK